MPRRVVIIDDQPDIRELLRSYLEGTGEFEVLAEAANGDEGLQQVEKCRPDVVVLDVLMPVMTGIEALPLLREAVPEARIVVYSTVTARQAVEIGLAGGADAYVEKTASRAELVEALLGC